MLQPSFVERCGRQVQFQQRSLKLMLIVLVTISCTLFVPPQATMASYDSPLNARISVHTSLLDQQRKVTIEYSFSPRTGGLAVETVFVGYDGWQEVKQYPATRTKYDLGGVTYAVWFVIPDHVRTIDFAFTDGIRWDNNNGADYHAVPAPWTPTWAGNLTPTTLSVPAGTPVEITAQVFEPGVTDQLQGYNFNDDIHAQLWYGINGTWLPAPMRFKRNIDNKSEYVHFFDTSGLASGTVIEFTCRFSADGAVSWRWCDLPNGQNAQIEIE